MIITFVNAKRVDKHTVDVTYELSGTLCTVRWSDVHPGTGELTPYYLKDDVNSWDYTLAERISHAIKAGESDDNDDLDVYLFIRDTFDAFDAFIL